MKKNTVMLFMTLALTCTLNAREYIAPPSSSTRGSVPVISDEAMEKCVKIYNEAKWLREEINDTYVNQYDNTSVNNYNQKVNKVKRMTNYFNQNCAGKPIIFSLESSSKTQWKELA